MIEMNVDICISNVSPLKMAGEEIQQQNKNGRSRNGSERVEEHWVMKGAICKPKSKSENEKQ